MAFEPVFRAPKGLPEGYYACHSSPHWMDSIPHPATLPRPGGIVHAWWRCNRCGTERYDQLDPVTLQAVARKYNWPDDYRDAKVDRGAWKAEYFKMLGILNDRQASTVRKYRKETWEGIQ